MSKILTSKNSSHSFKQSEFEPGLYNEVLEDYQAGNKYLIKKWEWGKGEEKIYGKIIDCPTLNDFNREVWDFFAEFAKTDGYPLTWGAFGLEHSNPYKPQNSYCDGVIFYICADEFKECIEHKEIARFLSCMIHFGYFHLKFECVPNV